MLRIRSEHVIGILKGRFAILKSIPMKVTNDSNSLKQILQIINSSIILHNFLLDIKNEDPDRWLDPDDDISDIDLHDIEEMVVGNEDGKDERRQRLMDYFRDYVF